MGFLAFFFMVGLPRSLAISSGTLYIIPALSTKLCLLHFFLAGAYFSLYVSIMELLLTFRVHVSQRV